jgi:hypothetical protein
VTRLVVFPVALAALVVAGCGSDHHAASSTPAAGTTVQGSTIANSRSVSAPRCTTSALAVWLGVGEGGGTAGSTYYPVELSNISNHACHLRGFPGVSAWSGHQLGSPARRDHAQPVQTVTLTRGDTAHVLVRITDVGNLPATSCRPATATQLKVFPPDERAARFVPFSFRACSKSGPVFLSVRAVEPGVGIPGFSQ